MYFLLLSSLGYNVAKTLSFITGSMVAYGLNKFWTFRNPSRDTWEVLRFCVLYAATLGINVVVNHGMMTLWPGAAVIAAVCATGASMVLNFLGQKFWVFRRFPTRESLL